MSRTRRIAPRLANGESRARLYNAFPPEMKLALQTIAARDSISLNFLMEQKMLEAFRLRRPVYRKEKTR